MVLRSSSAVLIPVLNLSGVVCLTETGRLDCPLILPSSCISLSSSSSAVSCLTPRGETLSARVRLVGVDLRSKGCPAERRPRGEGGVLARSTSRLRDAARVAGVDSSTSRRGGVGPLAGPEEEAADGLEPVVGETPTPLTPSVLGVGRGSP